MWTIFLLLFTLFKMKKVQLQLNQQGLTNEQVINRLKKFLRNAWIFLVVFVTDIIVKICYIIALWINIAKQDVIDRVELVLAFVSGSIMFLWFFYFVFLTIYFWQMGEEYVRILKGQHTSICKYRLLLGSLAILFVVGISYNFLKFLEFPGIS